MDAITGKLLNDFTGHVHSSYRCRTCFGHGEASVIAGDENGAVWAWDLLDVSSLTFVLTGDIYLSISQRRPNLSNPILPRRYIIKS
jgi:hypothetical protein